MDKYNKIIAKLEEKGVIFNYGMSSQEIAEVEEFHSVSFPIEIKKLFTLGLPVSNGFYDWRNMSLENTKHIKKVLEMHIKGLQSGLMDGEFWCEDWGLQPESIEEAQKVLLKRYNDAPKLIPIYSHRYMPFIPEKTNIPVFSIMQSDIIYYGMDLISYLEVEFGFRQYNDMMQSCFQYVTFWSDLL